MMHSMLAEPVQLHMAQSVDGVVKYRWMQVRYEYGKLSYEKLREAGVNVTFQHFEGMGHSVNPKEVQSVVAFWQKCLPSQ